MKERAGGTANRSRVRTPPPPSSAARRGYRLGLGVALVVAVTALASISIRRQPDPRPIAGADAPPDVLVASDCRASELELRATPDRARYSPGETIRVTVEIRNRSPRRCDLRGGPTPLAVPEGSVAPACAGSLLVADATTGQGVWTDSRPAHACNDATHTYEPGETSSRVVEWRQETCVAEAMDRQIPCGGPPAAPGRYTVAAYQRVASSPATPFEIAAGR